MVKVVFMVIILHLLFELTSCLPYLVFLNGSNTIETVNLYLNKFEPNYQFKAYVKSSFSIGKLSGFAGEFSKETINKLKNCPFISEVTPDIFVKANGIVVEQDVPRHLARLSQRESLRGHQFEYFYDEEACGQGVNAYVIDSGIRIDHPQFEGRARNGIDLTPEGINDYNGHGTHVAGLIGSSQFGVSKYVELVSVKALDRFGSGSLSMIISAIEFAVKDMNQTKRRGVANLSLGAAKNRALNKVVDAAVDAGLVMVVAAGNENANACSTSPASAHKAITVGSIDDLDDSLTSFTNWGSCVDIFAPGKFVASANIRNTEVPLILSGTSMSAPQIAGLVANGLSIGIKSSEIKNYIITNSSKGKIPRSSLRFKFRTPNRIAFHHVGNPKNNESEKENEKGKGNEEDYDYDDDYEYYNNYKTKKLQKIQFITTNPPAMFVNYSPL